MRFLRIVLCAALVGGIVAASGSTALAECETVWVPAYDVELDVRRAAYRLGDTAVIDVTVTRTDTGVAVDRAAAIVYIPPTGDTFVFGGAYTDDSGHAVVRLKLKKKEVRPGPVTIVGRGQKQAADAASCAQVMEYGEKRLEDAFVVRR